MLAGFGILSNPHFAGSRALEQLGKLPLLSSGDAFAGFETEFRAGRGRNGLAENRNCQLVSNARDGDHRRVFFVAHGLSQF